MAEVPTPGGVLFRARWLIADKAARLVGGLLVGVVVARYFGPEQYGHLNFAQAWVALFSGVAWLGIGDAVVRDLVRHRGSAALLLGCAWRLRLAGSLIAAFAALSSFWLLHADDRVGIALVAICATSVIVLETASANSLLLQARSDFRAIGMARNVGFAAHQLYRLAVVGLGLGVVAISFGAIFEAIAIGAILLSAAMASASSGGRRQWDGHEAKRMLWQGLPIMIGALFTTMFQRIDQVILGQLSGHHELGLYSAAVRLSEIWWALPTIMMQVLAPGLLFSVDIDDATRQRRLTELSSMLFYVAVLVAAVVSLVAPAIVPLALGDRYAAATPVLVVHVWIAVFVFLDAAAYQYVIAVNLQRVLVWKAVAALLANVLFASLLAPRHGALGVAYATLTAFAVSTLVGYALPPSTRHVARCQIRAIASPHILVRRFWRLGSTGHA